MIEGAQRIKDLIKNQAGGDNGKAQMLLRHFAMERLLEWLSLSPYKDDFIIKGGMLISSMRGVDERMTRDVDAALRDHELSAANVKVPSTSFSLIRPLGRSLRLIRRPSLSGTSSDTVGSRAKTGSSKRGL